MKHEKKKSGGRRLQTLKRKRQRKKKQIRLLIYAAVCLLLLVMAGVYLSMRKYVNSVDKAVICENIYIGSQNVSGMNEEQAKKAVEKHREKDAAKKVTVKTQSGAADVTLGDLGLTAENTDRLIEKAVNYGKTGSTWSRYWKMKKLQKENYVIKEEFQLDPDTAGAALTKTCSPLLQAAVDAKIEKSGDGFKITSEQEGKKLDIDKTITVITDHINKSWDHKEFSIDAVTETDKPEVTEKDLETIQDELGSFWTYAGGGERLKNLENGTEKLSGTVLMPGETLSVGQTTGPFNAENGYVQAGAYENGQVVEDYGGGICQVSTTLYNAVIYAELEIVERSPHSMTVAYVKPSRDAAIAGDYLDFKFKNNYDTPIYIYGEVNDSGQLQFIIYGKETRPENRTVEYESETVGTKEYGTTYKENPDAPAGSMEATGTPHDGVDAILWKIVYEDGEEVSREQFNTSHYEPLNQTVEVGTASDNAEVVSMLQKAIASQDADKISEAVEKAAALESGASREAEKTDGTKEEEG